MNHSIYSADRSTHLKIVAVALIAGISITALGIFARANVEGGSYMQSVRIIKADKPVMVTNSGTSVVR